MHARPLPERHARLPILPASSLCSSRNFERLEPTWRNRLSLVFLMSLNDPPEINRADEAVGLIRVGIGPIRYGGSRTQIIGRPASQDNDLKDARFLGEQSPKPVHAVAITLHQLIIKHY